MLKSEEGEGSDVGGEEDDEVPKGCLTPWWDCSVGGVANPADRVGDTPLLSSSIRSQICSISIIPESEAVTF